MEHDALRKLMEDVRTGICPVDNALERLRYLPFESIDFACLDHHRGLRTGIPEAVFGESKTAD